MDRIKRIIKRNSLTLIGILAGAVGGFLFWYYIGCQTGSCPITSSPVATTIWGAILGAVVFNAFQENTNTKR